MLEIAVYPTRESGYESLIRHPINVHWAPALNGFYICTKNGLSMQHLSFLWIQNCHGRVKLQPTLVPMLTAAKCEVSCVLRMEIWGGSVSNGHQQIFSLWTFLSIHICKKISAHMKRLHNSVYCIPYAIFSLASDSQSPWRVWATTLLQKPIQIFCLPPKFLCAILWKDCVC